MSSPVSEATDGLSVQLLPVRLVEPSRTPPRSLSPTVTGSLSAPMVSRSLSPTVTGSLSTPMMFPRSGADIGNGGGSSLLPTSCRPTVQLRQSSLTPQSSCTPKRSLSPQSSYQPTRLVSVSPPPTGSTQPTRLLSVSPPPTGPTQPTRLLSVSPPPTGSTRLLSVSPLPTGSTRLLSYTPKGSFNSVPQQAAAVQRSPTASVSKMVSLSAQRLGKGPTIANRTPPRPPTRAQAPSSSNMAKLAAPPAPPATPYLSGGVPSSAKAQLASLCSSIGYGVPGNSRQAKSAASPSRSAVLKTANSPAPKSQAGQLGPGKSTNKSKGHRHLSAERRLKKRPTWAAGDKQGKAVDGVKTLTLTPLEAIPDDTKTLQPTAIIDAKDEEEHQLSMGGLLAASRFAAKLHANEQQRRRPAWSSPDTPVEVDEDHAASEDEMPFGMSTTMTKDDLKREQELREQFAAELDLHTDALAQAIPDDTKTSQPTAIIDAKDEEAARQAEAIPCMVSSGFQKRDEEEDFRSKSAPGQIEGQRSRPVWSWTDSEDEMPFAMSTTMTEDDLKREQKLREQHAAELDLHTDSMTLATQRLGLDSPQKLLPPELPAEMISSRMDQC